MAEQSMPVLDLLPKGEEAREDPLREIVRWTIQELMEAEVSAQIGAGRYERSDERSAQRNGYRERPWDTRVGTLELQIPKQLLPELAGAASAGGAGAGGGDRRSVRPGGEHAEGRGGGPSAGDQRDLAQ
jgi:hypothetical protein